MIKQGVYREEDISEILGVGNFIDVCVEANIFFIGEGLASVSHGYVSRYIHDMRAVVFFVLIFRIKIVVGLWVSGQLVVKRRVVHLSIGLIHGSNDQLY